MSNGTESKPKDRLQAQRVVLASKHALSFTIGTIVD